MSENVNIHNYSDLIQPIKVLVDNVEQLHNIINVAMRGMSITQAIPKAVSVLAKYEGTGNTEKHKKKLEETERIAGIAKKEIDAGFPFLYTQSAIMLYSYLEGAIKRLIITFLKNNNISKIKEVANIKIIFSEFIGLDEGEKYDYIFSQYEKSITMGIQYGINRFESLLSPIGLNGKVNPSLSKNIFELSQLRNNILHRGGTVDKYLKSNCPWLKYELGETIRITNEQYEKYYSSITRYAMVLIIRMGDKTGREDLEEFREVDEEE